MKVSVVKQGVFYYTRIQVGGKRIKRSLNTADKAVALVRAKQLKTAMLADRWDESNLLQTKKFSTLEEIATAYRVAALSRFGRMGKPSSESLRATLSAFDRAVGGCDSRTSACLTKKLLVEYCDRKTAGKTGLVLARARRTAASDLVKARSVFSKWALEAYREAGLVIADVVHVEFLKTRPVDGSMKKYRVPLEHPELVAATIAAGRELAISNPRLHLVFLLSYELALRAGESIFLKWSWFRVRELGCSLDIIERPGEGFKPKGTERSIPVHPDTYKAIGNSPANGSTFILPGASRSARRDLITREFSLWMRSIGWTRELFSKTNHELRKLQGSRWYTEVSPQAAQEWLGHADIATTCRFYACLKTQPEPLAPECV